MIDHADLARKGSARMLAPYSIRRGLDRLYKIWQNAHESPQSAMPPSQYEVKIFLKYCYKALRFLYLFKARAEKSVYSGSHCLKMCTYRFLLALIIIFSQPTQVLAGFSAQKITFNEDFSLIKAIESRNVESVRKIVNENRGKIAFDYENICATPYKLVPLTFIDIMRAVLSSDHNGMWQTSMDDPHMLLPGLGGPVNELYGPVGTTFPTRCSGLFMGFAIQVAKKEILESSYVDILIPDDWAAHMDAGKKNLRNKGKQVYKEWIEIFEIIDAATPVKDKYIYPYYAAILASRQNYGMTGFSLGGMNFEASLWFVNKYLKSLPEITKNRESIDDSGLNKYQKILALQAHKWKNFSGQNPANDPSPIRTEYQNPLFHLYIYFYEELPIILSRFYFYDCKSLEYKTLSNLNYKPNDVSIFDKDHLSFPDPEELTPGERIKVFPLIKKLAELQAYLNYFKTIVDNINLNTSLQVPIQPDAAQYDFYYKKHFGRGNLNQQLHPINYKGATALITQVRKNAEPKAVKEYLGFALTVLKYKKMGIDFEAAKESGLTAKDLLLRSKDHDLMMKILSDPDMTAIPQVITGCQASN